MDKWLLWTLSTQITTDIITQPALLGDVIVETLKVLVGFVLGGLAYLAQNWYRTEKKEGNRLKKLEKSMYGKEEEWLHRGVLEVLEDHEKELKALTNRVGQLEIKITVSDNQNGVGKDGKSGQIDSEVKDKND